MFAPSIEDGIPARVLPDAGDDVDRAEPGGFIHKVDGLSAQRDDQVIDDAVGGGEQDVQDAGQNHRGDEVRDIDGGLGELLQALPADVVDHNGQEDRNREGEEKAQHIEQEGIPDQASEVVGLEECNEVLEAVHRGPGTADNAADSLVILEGDLDTVHRKIVEDDQVDQSRKNQKIEPAVLENAVSQFSES